MLEIMNLTVLEAGGKRLLDDVSLSLDRGQRVCLTGVSGSGKTTLIRMIMGLGSPGLSIAGGDIRLDEESLFAMPRRQRRALCGSVLGFIPQNAMNAFFPTIRLGRQLVETYRLRYPIHRSEARAMAIEHLKRVNLNDADRVMNAFPSQLSGGMLQRVSMSLLLGTKPQYILADEPTSALDVANRELLVKLLEEYREGGILFVSHDVKAIRTLCDTTLVLESGRITEARETQALFKSPQTPWSKKFVEAARLAREGDAQWKVLW